MESPLKFLIIDGYPRESRDELEAAGMKLAWKLYADMLLKHLPDAGYDVLLPSDPEAAIPAPDDLAGYAGMLWTGCNLSINDAFNPSVRAQIELARTGFEKGIPAFGSCWGLQIAVVAAGGEVQPNPKGKEMGLARKIYLTEAGRAHPMYRGKPAVFEAFISHDDMVTTLPEGGVLLAGNGFTAVQAAAISHKNGQFWAVQYHPEYDLHEMACLIVAREPKLISGGFYQDHADLMTMVGRMQALAAEPDRKDLRWQLTIDDDVLDQPLRQCEFANWLDTLVRPGSGSESRDA